jgi:hypothetical protein
VVSDTEIKKTKRKYNLLWEQVIFFAGSRFKLKLAMAISNQLSKHSIKNKSIVFDKGLFLESLIETKDDGKSLIVSRYKEITKYSSTEISTHCQL